jgi:hypothetical protein
MLTPDQLPHRIELRPAEEPGGLVELVEALAAIVAERCTVDAPSPAVLPSKPPQALRKKKKAA